MFVKNFKKLHYKNLEKCKTLKKFCLIFAKISQNFQQRKHYVYSKQDLKKNIVKFIQYGLDFKGVTNKFHAPSCLQKIKIIFKAKTTMPHLVNVWVTCKKRSIQCLNAAAAATR